MKDFLIAALISIVILAVVIPPVLLFGTQVNTYILENPTTEQILAIVKGDLQNRVWYSEARYLLGSSALVEVDLRARIFEDDRINEFLDKLGVTYTLIKTGR